MAELTLRELEEIEKEFAEFMEGRTKHVRQEERKSSERRDYKPKVNPLSQEVENFCEEKPISSLGQGTGRCVFEFESYVGYEDPVVVKFPREPRRRYLNKMEEATWYAVEQGWDDEIWYAEVVECSDRGEVLVQEKVSDRFSWVAENIASLRFRRKGLYFDNGGAAGFELGRSLQPKLTDFPVFQPSDMEVPAELNVPYSSFNYLKGKYAGAEI